MSSTVIRENHQLVERKPSVVKKSKDESRSDNQKILSQNHADDIAFAHALHGTDVKTGLWSNLRTKDAEKYESISETYFNMWGKDATHDNDDNMKKRASQYSTLVNSYYNLATDFYEYGWGKSFHFCRFYPGEDLSCALKRHEHYLALKTGIEPGMKVLDIGCGVGSPAREISHLTGAHIIGLNNNAYQIEKARNYAVQEDLQDKLRFLKGDFMHIPFEDNTFDRTYAIEATCHAPSFEGVYKEIYRILKPGGKFGCYEWCMTDNYDPSNPKHKEIAHGIALGNSLPDVRTISNCLEALQSVGFEIEIHMDLANMGDRIHWYYPLEGNLSQCQTVRDVFHTLCMTPVGRFTTTNICKMLEKVGLAPNGTVQTQNLLEVAADALVAGARENIFTPMFFFVAKKPAEIMS